MRSRTLVKGAETGIMNRHNSAETFRGFMLRIAYELTSTDWKNLAYYLGDKIPAGKREDLSKIPVELFEELEKSGHLGPDNLEFLQTSLKSIGRQDLAGEVENFDSSRKPRLEPKGVNYVESSGYYLSVDGGEHLVDEEGHDYVYVPSGQDYQLVINNSNSHRCKCKISIDGRVIFPGLVVKAGREIALDRPSNTDGKFKFFAIRDAPPDSGIDRRNAEENGSIEVTFTPEVAKMEIICYINNGENTRIVSPTCPLDMTDVEFHNELSRQFSGASATVMIDGYKPLGKRNIRLVDYGIKNGSRVFINCGFVGGVPNIGQSEINSHAPIKWIPGATTLQGQSEKTYRRVFDFVPNNETRKVVLHLRLIAKADDIPIPSNGTEYNPFVLGNFKAPPIKNTE